ncbi:MAG: FliA/WhiG family RNA polymerase sigma factor [Acidobacteriota bacterium]|nr:FliA/WhiG family RNA polymerase sigma factor [Acidobacteriota bacterium]
MATSQINPEPPVPSIFSSLAEPLEETCAAEAAAAPVSEAPPNSLSLEEQHDLVVSHLEDVKMVARGILRRLPPSVQLDDLIQAGSIGLVDAARRFGPSRNLPFRQYARIRITGAIFDSLRELDWASRYFRTRQQKLDNANRELERRLGRRPTSDEVAEHMGMDLNSYYEFALAVQDLQEVDFEPQEDGERLSIQESIAGNPEERPDAVCHRHESARELQQFIAQLPRDEATVLTMYYFQERTMARIAKSIGKTESRVSQIHAKALVHLRDLLGPRRAAQLLSRVL